MRQSTSAGSGSAPDRRPRPWWRRRRRAGGQLCEWCGEICDGSCRRDQAVDRQRARAVTDSIRLPF